MYNQPERVIETIQKALIEIAQYDEHPVVRSAAVAVLTSYPVEIPYWEHLGENAIRGYNFFVEGWLDEDAKECVVEALVEAREIGLLARIWERERSPQIGRIIVRRVLLYYTSLQPREREMFLPVFAEVLANEHDEEFVEEIIRRLTDAEERIQRMLVTGSGT